MKKEWFFDRFCGEQIAIYAEDGKIIEVGVENEKSGEVLGNIYKGKVMNVVGGMQAAFIACGMERNCYLPLNEEDVLLSRYDGSGNPGFGAPALKEGDEILVQVVKTPRGSKGAKVSCALSFVGKTLIYLPRTDFLGISRKITEEKTRAELLAEADKLRKRGEGFIVRTAALGATKKQLKIEAEYLRQLCRETLENALTAPIGTAVYRECELPVKVMRDSLGDDCKVYVGDSGLYEKVVRLARYRSDEKHIVRYTGERSMFNYYGLDEQIYALTSAQIPLDNGSYLVLDRTEAMTVFDVNTGKFTGESDLESTVFQTNLFAAKEIARQVRLRNIGGIIAVDFIDMTEEAHRTAVGETLERALAEDRVKSRVLPMNELGVILFTRKRLTRELSSFLLKPCSHCTRQGYVLSEKYMAMRIRTAILNCFSEGYGTAIIELNRGLMNKILSEGYFSAELADGWKDKRVYFIPHSAYPEERFALHGDNSPILSLPDGAQILY